MTEKPLTIEKALQIAVKEEIKAYNLYNNASKNVTSPGTKVMLLELAEQELNHRNILESIQQEKTYQLLAVNIPQQSSGISDFLISSEITENATIQEVMIFAMKEEEKAFNFYNELKDFSAGTELEDLFGRLAAEEKVHKIRLEDEYEKHILKDN